MKPYEHQLLLSKYLFLRGSDALRENGRFSAGLAVSLFQDAVESLVSTVAKELGASIPPNTNFHAYWELVKKAPNAQGKELPPSGKMVELNSARVAFKHHGIVPAQEAAANLELHAEQFLSEATLRFFNLEFATLSLVSFLSDKEAAGLPIIRRAGSSRLTSRVPARGSAVESLESCGGFHRHHGCGNHRRVFRSDVVEHLRFVRSFNSGTSPEWRSKVLFSCRRFGIRSRTFHELALKGRLGGVGLAPSVG